MSAYTAYSVNRVDRRVPAGGVLLALLIAIIGGFLSGALAAGVAYFFYLVPLSPLIHFGVVLALGQWAIRAGKVRQAFVALLIGLVLGLISVTTYRAGEYVGVIIAAVVEGEERDNLLQAFRSQQVLLDKGLENEVDQGGVIGWLDYSADQGMEFTSTRSYSSSNSPMTFDRNATLIYWAVEGLAIIAGAVIGAVGQARNPYSVAQGRWISERDYWHIASVPANMSRDFLKTIRANDRQTALQYLQPPSPDRRDLHIYTFEEPLPNGQPGHLIRVRQPTGRNQMKDVYRTTLTEGEFRRWEDRLGVQPSDRFDFGMA